MSDVTFAVSGQHYLFDVQAFAHTILNIGGESYTYALRDRTTLGVIDDVAERRSEIGVVMTTTTTNTELEKAFASAGLRFTKLAESKPCVALPASHPLSNARSLTIADLEEWPYLKFEQRPGTPEEYSEEALDYIPRSKTILCNDRASLSELAVAINGYTVTSGILVGITDGGSLTTVPLETDVRLNMGYLSREGEQLSDLGQTFVAKLRAALERYAA